MQAETGVGNKHALSDRLAGGGFSCPRETNGYATIPISSSPSISSPSFFSSPGANFIEHPVSKMDTLAGIAIKYGVEVGDIRKMNGLVTDLQMFAHRSLQIPLPGRHPPSRVMANGSRRNSLKKPQHQVLDSADTFQSPKPKPSPCPVSPAMCTLQGYYGLTKYSRSRLPEGTEMAVFKSGRKLLLEEDTFVLESPASDPVHRTKKLANGLSPDHSQDINELERSIRRRPRADDDLPILLKEGAGGVFSGRAGKGLALRPKPGSRTDLDECRQNSSSGGDSLTGDAALALQKSSSASNLSEPESMPSVWPKGKWSLKPDGIARPIFDGLPKPMAAWRNKAALD